MMQAMERISQAELLDRLAKQGVSDPKHYAFRCVVCSTVQSSASLHTAGLSYDKVDRVLGFSCEGRITGAGPWPSDKNKTAKAKNRRSVRGCDWTLGGLFTIHSLEVLIPVDGAERARPCFDLASADEAQALEREITSRSEATSC